MSFVSDVEAVGKKIEGALIWVFKQAENEIPAIVGLLINLYGPQVVSTAIASHQAGVQMYADKEIAVAGADVTALVQSTLVSKFGSGGLANTAAQFVASAVNHLVTVGESDLNALIAKGAAAAEAATGVPPAA
jgi:hypothetical protein